MNNDREPTRATEWYLDHIAADAERFAVVLESGRLDDAVAACPGWDLARLTEHMGQIHRWARFCAANGRPPSDDEAAGLESFDRPNAAAWLRDGARELLATLRTLDPDAPTWHPFPTPQIASFWPRRQAHETAIHRWDAERAVDTPTPIDAELASDGIDEYFEAALPRLLVRGHSLPAGSIHVHCTDVAGEWLAWNEEGEYRMIRAHQKGDAALRGPAEAILLRLWGRTSERAGELDPVGDEAVLTAWTSIGGV